MEELSKLFTDIVQIARLGLAGKTEDVRLFAGRMARRNHVLFPQLGADLMALLKDSPTRGSVLRREVDPVPVDLDSRLQLLRFEEVSSMETEIILRDSVRDALEQIISEHGEREHLQAAGLSPTKSVLFTGVPGVGKTLAARWLAWKLQVPLLVLDLSAVMSSFLGRTGNNVRHVLNYAKKGPCVLLLDEFDAIAKKRDDSTEVGELKRLVTVLLQEIDDWPATGLLIAATNHPDLLDPAVWRRFEVKVEFPLPNEGETKAAIRTRLMTEAQDETLVDVLALLLEGQSFSEIERILNLMRRSAAMKKGSLREQMASLLAIHGTKLPKSARQNLAVRLTESGIVTQREAHELTGVSRDTIRKRAMETSLPPQARTKKKEVRHG